MKINTWLDPDIPFESDLYKFLETPFSNGETPIAFVKLLNKHPVEFEAKLKSIYPSFKFTLSEKKARFFEIEANCDEVKSKYYHYHFKLYIWLDGEGRMTIEADYIANFQNFMTKLVHKFAIPPKPPEKELFTNQFADWLNKL